jgi:hypothetical protein
MSCWVKAILLVAAGVAVGFYIRDKIEKNKVKPCGTCNKIRRALGIPEIDQQRGF